MRLLLVEDDIRLVEVLAEALQDYSYVVDVVGDGEAGLDQAIREEYSLILLDVMLPKLDGVSLCRSLRSRGCAIPILMVTARDASTDKVAGLDAGADDYLVKPLDLPELLARIRALLRRGQAIAQPVLQWGALQLDPSCYSVTYNRSPLHLTPKEFSLLELFLRSGQRVLSRRTIVGQLWSYDDPPVEDSVKAHVKALRHKLKAVGAPPDAIENIRGVGYRLKQLA
ncbi:response regulator transcription factor [Synechococcus sp. PCC 7336]|uniref:response regulator transcription factor n=1 Tax=Synechococcus sp. PCC 7336 TaxID=195250 RepID=UPI00036D44A5|nr:response regulator transcription factor [Synechococcus sp. PCC 7336]